MIPLPNADQAKDAGRTAITAAVAYAAGRHWLGDDTAALILTLAPLAWPFAWGLMMHTNTAKVAAVADMPMPERRIAFNGIPDSAKLRAVEDMPAVKAVLVRESIATNGIADALADDRRPKVQPAPKVE